ncbi:hypothetical protein EX895_005471 [Sporisorium graminicola]|uniref:Sulphur transport domain-containing protein n=1 Tax=Sporisorium graminicola TaxID=280036 RepID=A0A4V6EUW7_9BASI|nr:hypothetical protein EX895_005471 [Sporisorium graminicola]TKY85309.1 hypothetical protein EX895_005471 [Sporisorium graminicola]
MTAGLAEFTPFHSLAGGLMMAASLHTLLSKLGLVLGISGFFHSTVSSTWNAITGSSRNATPTTPSAAPSSIFPLVARYFTTGILLGGVVLGLTRSRVEAGLGVSILDDVSSSSHASLLSIVGLGALVGLGTKLGSGCTSGHFLCGLSRFSLRSLVATATFFGVAVLTHVSIASKAAVSAAAIRSSFFSHLPTTFPQPDFTTLLALQTPALVYMTAPEMLGVADPSASSEPNKKKNQLLAAKIMSLAVGVHFSFALGISGMMRPSKVLGFLSLSPRLISSGAWDPSLAMVAIGGIIPASVAYFRHVKPKQDELRRRSAAASNSKKDAKVDAQLQPALSLVAPEWRTPANPSKIDVKLVVGSVLFGLGWGATGLCPGPALASLSSLATQAFTQGSFAGVTDILAFVAAMAVGGQVAGLL